MSTHLCEQGISTVRLSALHIVGLRSTWRTSQTSHSCMCCQQDQNVISRRQCCIHWLHGMCPQ